MHYDGGWIYIYPKAEGDEVDNCQFPPNTHSLSPWQNLRISFAWLSSVCYTKQLDMSTIDILYLLLFPLVIVYMSSQANALPLSFLV